MIKTNNKPRQFHSGLILTALIFLCNANITVIDPLPDFVGYFLLIGAFSFAAKRVPYLEEVRSGFTKLAILSLLRVPAFFLIIKIRGSNTADTDVYTLASLVFCVLEILLAFSVISKLFTGISYLGERTGCKAIIGEQPSSDFLRTLTMVFTVIKCVGYAIPEFARLTSADSIGTLTNRTESMRFYPILFVVFHIVTYVVGFVWVAYFARYLKRIKLSGEYFDAVMAFSDDEKELRIAKEERVSRLTRGLSLLTPAALLSFDLTFDSLEGINILPHFIFSIILLVALHMMTPRKCALHYVTLGLGGLYSVYSIFAWIKTISFYEKHTIFETLLYDDAEAAYRQLELIFAAEFVFLALFITAFTLVLIRFIKTHTATTAKGLIDPYAEGVAEKSYSDYDKSTHRTLARKSWCFFAFSIVVGVLRGLNVILDDNREFVDGTLIPKIAPWIGTLLVIVAIIYAIYTNGFVTTLKSEVKMKYGDPGYEPPVEQLKSSDDFH